jgi:hypothetical protein
MAITYARFSSHTAARDASRLVQKQLGSSGRVRVLRDSQRLSHHMIPLCMTAARFGTVFGGAVVAVLSTITAGIFFYVIGLPGEPIPAPVATLALCVGLSTLLGCLAGALCFATDSNATVQRMREWLHDGKPVLIIETSRGHEQTLRHLGAEQVGKFG